MEESQQVSDVSVETNMVSTSQYEEVADKDDLMGVEDTAKKGILPAGPAAGGDVDSESGRCCSLLDHDALQASSPNPP